MNFFCSSSLKFICWKGMFSCNNRYFLMHKLHAKIYSLFQSSLSCWWKCIRRLSRVGILWREFLISKTQLIRPVNTVLNVVFFLPLFVEEGTQPKSVRVCEKNKIVFKKWWDIKYPYLFLCQCDHLPQSYDTFN